MLRDILANACRDCAVYEDLVFMKRATSIMDHNKYEDSNLTVGN